MQKSSIDNKNLKNVQNVYLIKNEQLKYFLSNQVMRLTSIVSSKILQNYLKNPNETALLKDFFYNIAKTSNDIMQIRLLDLHGQEQIRIDRANSTSLPIIVPDIYLQNKASHYYFKEILNQKKRHIWFSYIDLNKEHGKIEKPIKPVIRIGVPVYNQNNNKVAILIINIFMKNILTILIQSPIYNLSIVDKDGFTLLNNQNVLFEKQLSHSKSLQKRYSNYKVFLKNDTVYSNTILARTLTLENKQMLKFIIEPKNRNIIERNEHNFKFLGMVLLGIILLSYPIAYLFSRQQETLHKNNRHLGKQLDTQTQELVTTISQLSLKHYQDYLTKLPNRNQLIDDLRSIHKPALMLIDINKFKKINDLYGNEIGDEVLLLFTEILKKIKTDDNCTLYRLASDEFVILNPKPNEKNICLYRAEHLVDIMHNEALIVGEEKINLDLSITIGFSKFEDNPLEKANMALSHAKKTKENIVQFHKDLQPQQHYKDEMKWTLAIKEAIADDRIIPYFQAIVHQEKPVKYECLIRMKKDEDIISPFFFLDLAKQTKYYTELTHIMIKKSFIHFHNLGINFSINFAYEDINNQKTIDYLLKQLDIYKCAHLLTIEILESEDIENFEILRSFIQQMRSLGVKIAIDDFGSGYSNFSYLLEIQPDFIKIDGSIIKNIGTDKNSLFIAQTITEFAHKLEIEVIGEYVHNKAVYEKLKSIHIDYAQGYYLDEPSEKLLEIQETNL